MRPFHILYNRTKKDWIMHSDEQISPTKYAVVLEAAKKFPIVRKGRPKKRDLNGGGNRKFRYHIKVSVFPDERRVDCDCNQTLAKEIVEELAKKHRHGVVQYGSGGGVAPDDFGALPDGETQQEGPIAPEYDPDDPANLIVQTDSMGRPVQ